MSLRYEKGSISYCLQVTSTGWTRTDVALRASVRRHRRAQGSDTEPPQAGSCQTAKDGSDQSGMGVPHSSETRYPDPCLHGSSVGRNEEETDHGTSVSWGSVSPRLSACRSPPRS